MAKKKKNITSSELAKQLAKIGRKCSQGTIRTYWQEGAPRDSAQKFLRWLEENHPPRASDGAVKAKRLEKLDGEIRVLHQVELRAKRRNEKEAGELVPFVDIEFVLAKTLSAFCAALDKTFDEKLPALLKGLNEMEIRNHCRAEKDLMLDGLRAEFQKFLDGQENKQP